MLTQLTPSERTIYDLWCGIGRKHSLDRMGITDELGVSRQHVHQTLKRIAKKTGNGELPSQKTLEPRARKLPNYLSMKKCEWCSREFLGREKRKFCSMSCSGKWRNGSKHPCWKGDQAQKYAGYCRAKRVRPRLGNCERCNEPARHRHHRDENPLNNILSNIEQLCHKCHMAEHVRLRRERVRCC